MKLIPAFLLCMLLSACVLGQVPSEGTTASDTPAVSSKVNYGVTVGTEFCTVSGLGSAWSTSVTPRIAVRVHKKFTLAGGIRLSRTAYNLDLTGNSEGTATRFNGTAHSAMLYLSGLYHLTDRLTFSGTAFGAIPLGGTVLPYDPCQPFPSRNARGVDLRVGYRVARNAFIEAGFRYSNVHPYNGNGPFPASGFPYESGNTFSGFGSPRW